MNEAFLILKDVKSSCSGPAWKEALGALPERSYSQSGSGEMIIRKIRGTILPPMCCERVIFSRSSKKSLSPHVKDKTT